MTGVALTLESVPMGPNVGKAGEPLGDRMEDSWVVLRMTVTRVSAARLMTYLRHR